MTDDNNTQKQTTLVSTKGESNEDKSVQKRERRKSSVSGAKKNTTKLLNGGFYSNCRTITRQLLPRKKGFGSSSSKSNGSTVNGRKRQQIVIGELSDAERSGDEEENTDDFKNSTEIETTNCTSSSTKIISPKSNISFKSNRKTVVPLSQATMENAGQFCDSLCLPLDDEKSISLSSFLSKKNMPEEMGGGDDDFEFAASTCFRNNGDNAISKSSAKNLKAISEDRALSTSSSAKNLKAISEDRALSTSSLVNCTDATSSSEDKSLIKTPEIDLGNMQKVEFDLHQSRCFVENSNGLFGRIALKFDCE